MGFFKGRFGVEEIQLSKDEELKLLNDIYQIDRRRIDFYALISFFCCIVFLFLDFFVFNDTNQLYYVLLDSSLLLMSIYLLLTIRSRRNKEGRHVTRAKIYPLDIRIYLILLLFWATAIASLNRDEILNVASFYIVVFVVAFTLTSSFRTYLMYLSLSILFYGFMSLISYQPFFSETLVLLLIGALLTMLFHRTISLNRLNSQAAFIRLSKLNIDLESEVSTQVSKLQRINNVLEYEIGQRKKIENKLRETLKRAEASDQLKTEFLANISHEIRTPLNAIIGFTEMITEDGVPLDQKRIFQQLVSSNTMYLLSTIDDIFDASMISTHQINPILKTFRVNALLDTIRYESIGVSVKYDKADLPFNIVKAENEQLRLCSDEYYLKKAIFRLIDNAYKFTSQGSIEVGVTQNVNGVEIYVQDTGIGIDKKDHRKIVEPFVQGNGSFTRGYGGSGLGLSIVDGIASELNFKLTFASEEGKGSRFSLCYNNQSTEA